MADKGRKLLEDLLESVKSGNAEVLFAGAIDAEDCDDCENCEDCKECDCKHDNEREVDEDNVAALYVLLRSLCYTCLIEDDVCKIIFGAWTKAFALAPDKDIKDSELTDEQKEMRRRMRILENNFTDMVIGKFYDLICDLFDIFLGRYGISRSSVLIVVQGVFKVMYDIDLDLEDEDVQ